MPARELSPFDRVVSVDAASYGLCKRCASLGERTTSIQDTLINYISIGASDSPAILLLHGIGGSWRTWECLMPHLAGEFRVVALDLPGFGKSGRPSGPLRLSRITSLLHEFCIGEIGRPFTVCGHSMGVLAAIDLAHTAPDLVSGVVTISGHIASALQVYRNPFASFLRHPVLTARFLGHLLTILLPWPSPLVRIALANLSMREFLLKKVVVHPDRVDSELLVRLALANRPRSSLAIQINGVGYRYEDHLSQVKCPISLIAGSGDGLARPADALSFRKIAPQTKTVLVDGIGHWGHIEDAALVSRLIADFANTQARCSL